MKFNTDGMTELQITVLHAALKSYAGICNHHSKTLHEINSDLAAMFKSRSWVADDMADGIELPQ